MLWDQLKEWKENCRWVELSHPLSPRTPHWSGFPDMADTTLFDYPDGFYVNKFELVSQYGTHVDAPAHFIGDARKNAVLLRLYLITSPICSHAETHRIEGVSDEERRIFATRAYLGVRDPNKKVL